MNIISNPPAGHDRVCPPGCKGLTPEDVVNAGKYLGLDTVKCRGHRVNSAIMLALGLAGASSKRTSPLQDAGWEGCFFSRGGL